MEDLGRLGFKTGFKKKMLAKHSYLVSLFAGERQVNTPPNREATYAGFLSHYEDEALK